MSTDNWRDEIGSLLMTPRMIVGGLTTGCLVFMVIVLFIIQPGQDPAGDGDGGMPLVTYIAIAWAGMAIGVRMVVLRIIESGSRKRIANGTWQIPTGGQQHAQPVQLIQIVERMGDAGKLWVVFQNRTIVGAAIFEGCAFFALIAYIIEQSPIALVTAIVMTFGVALHFPTRSGVTHWIEDQLAAIEQLRQFGS
jgi:hypothetical protein